MSQQGPIAVNSYADTAGGSVTWDTSTGNSGAITDIGTGSPVITDVLTCTFNAGDFTIPTLGNRIASITIFFDADGTTDMGGPTPTITSSAAMPSVATKTTDCSAASLALKGCSAAAGELFFMPSTIQRFK